MEKAFVYGMSVAGNNFTAQNIADPLLAIWLDKHRKG